MNQWQRAEDQVQPDVLGEKMSVTKGAGGRFHGDQKKKAAPPLGKESGKGVLDQSKERLPKGQDE